MAAGKLQPPQLRVTDPLCSTGCTASRVITSGSLRLVPWSHRTLATWTSSQSGFMSPIRLAADCPKTRRLPPKVCRALGIPEAVSGLLSAGVSAIGLQSAVSELGHLLAPHQAVLGPLAALDEQAQWRALAAAAVTLWYLTAKPGPLQGLLDLMWAPVSEKSFKSFDPASVSIGKQLGEGSFGVVFEGCIGDKRSGKPSGAGTRVILKKVKSKVLGAEEMRTSELYFNQRLQRTARGSCAEFLGTVQVDKYTQKGKLVEGLWLVWRYQGSSNLESFLRRRDFPAALAGDMLGERGVLVKANKEDVLQRDCAVVQAICRQLLDCLKNVHATGVVHRDVKPLNMVLDEETLRFTLIDLGACVDLRSGYNYVPDETIMDPIYCAPEQYILPINMPDAPPGPLMSLLAPLLFLAHTPDKFDLFSAGLVLMQLAVPTLRYDRNLAHFNTQLAASGYDLDKWRRSKLNFAESELEILDANGQAGWDLARSLLRPRDGLWCPRPTAAAALNHRFLTRTLRWATEAPPLAEKAGSGSKSGKQKSSSKSGKKLQPALAPALSSNKEVDAASGVGGYSLPFVNHSREGPRLADAGAKFDRKVKLKVRKEAAAGPQSAVAWTAFFPLSRPSRPQEATSEKSSSDPLIGLRRLVGLDGGALPTPPPKADTSVDFPHVAALAQLLGQTFLHQQVPVGLQPVGRAPGKAGKKGSAGKAKGGGKATDLAGNGWAPTAGLARDALPVAAASAAAVATGCLAVLLVKASVETGYSMGQGLAQALGVAALLALSYLYVLRPGLSAASRPPQSAFNLEALPISPMYEGEPTSGAIVNCAGLKRASGMAVGYTNWLVDQSTLQGPADTPAVETAGLTSSVREMEQQLASLEATIRGGHEFNLNQKQLLARVEALLLESTLRPAEGKAQVP